MAESGGRTLSRRDFIKLAAGAAASGLLFSERALAQPKTLKIAKWAHFVSEFDRWFEDELAGEWGKRHDTQVVVDHVRVEKIGAVGGAEVAAREGHDLFMFPWPPAEYQQHAIDHAEVHRTVASKHGNLHHLGHRSTFNPTSKKYFAFCDSWIPAPLHFFQDYWAEVNMPLGPVHYYSLRSGGQKIRAHLGLPSRPALAARLDGHVPFNSPPPPVTTCSVVWNFSRKQDGARQFLLNLMEISQTIYEKSRGCNFPIYPRTVPDLSVRLSNDPQADPSWKYEALKDAPRWTVNLGYPGFADPAAMEIYNSFVIPRMFLSVVKGERSPGDAARAAEAEVTKIVAKWTQALG